MVEKQSNDWSMLLQCPHALGAVTAVRVFSVLSTRRLGFAPAA